MKMTPRRAGRLRDELRQWLRSRHGIHTTYSQEKIDRGREDLGFSSDEDALFAYTLFGGDLMPDMVGSLSLSVSPEAIAEIINATSDSVFDAADLFIDD